MREILAECPHCGHNQWVYELNVYGSLACQRHGWNAFAKVTEETMSNSCVSIVKSSFNRIDRTDISDTGWEQRHCAAWLNPRGTERGIRAMLEGFAAFADAHETEDYTIGQDGFFGPYAEDMIRALLAMLNLDCGRFDCGTLDRLIRELAVAAGVELAD